MFDDQVYNVVLTLWSQVLLNTPCYVGSGMKTILIAGAARIQCHLSPGATKFAGKARLGDGMAKTCYFTTYSRGF